MGINNISVKRSVCKEDGSLSQQGAIMVVGIGGAGSIIVNQMSEGKIPVAECIVVNTDQQSLQQAHCPNKVQLGHLEKLPEHRDIAFGRKCAQESRDTITCALRGARAAILIAGLGGSVGTGAMPVVAEISKDLGIFTLCLVTTPFPYEGNKRIEVARQGLNELLDTADRVLVFSNEQAFASADRNFKFGEVMEQANGELLGAAQFLIPRINEPGFMEADAEDMLQTLWNAGFDHFTSASL